MLLKLVQAWIYIRKEGWVRSIVSLAPTLFNHLSAPHEDQLTQPLGGDHFHISWTLSHLSTIILLIYWTFFFLQFFFHFWLPCGIWSSRDKIWAAVETCATVVATTGSSTHCARLGIEPVSWHCSDSAGPMCHIKNSLTNIFEHLIFWVRHWTKCWPSYVRYVIYLKIS